MDNVWTWDPNEEASGGSFHVTDGLWSGVVVSAEPFTSSNGNPGQKVMIRLVNGPQAGEQHFGKEFRENFMNMPPAYWRLRQFRDVITGVVTPENQQQSVDWSALIGKAVGFELETNRRVWKRDDGESRNIVESVVKRWIDPRTLTDSAPADSGGV